MKYAEARIRTHTHRVRHLGYLVEQGTIDGDDARWVEGVCERDTFLSGMGGDELRRAFDDHA